MVHNSKVTKGNTVRNKLSSPEAVIVSSLSSVLTEILFTLINIEGIMYVFPCILYLTVPYTVLYLTTAI